MMTSIKAYIIFIAGICSLLVMVNGCVVEENTLSLENKIIADSIIGVQTKDLIIEIDSLCKLVYQEDFDRAVDSVSAVRLKEIEKYIPTK
jgi:hypothetical protein